MHFDNEFHQQHIGFMQNNYTNVNIYGT